MKLKKILSGFLAAAMAVTTMVTASVTAGAEDQELLPADVVLGGTQNFEYRVEEWEDPDTATPSMKDVIYNAFNHWNDPYECDDYAGATMEVEVTDLGNAKAIALFVNGNGGDNSCDYQIVEVKTTGTSKVTVDFGALTGKNFSQIGYRLEANDEVATKTEDTAFTGNITIKSIKLLDKVVDTTEYADQPVSPLPEFVDGSLKLEGTFDLTKISGSGAYIEVKWTSDGSNQYPGFQLIPANDYDTVIYQGSGSSSGSQTTKIMLKNIADKLQKSMWINAWGVSSIDSITIHNDKTKGKVYDATPSYILNIGEDIENGTVSADVKNAKEGDTITLTVTPAKGYEVDEIAVYSWDGDKLLSVDVSKKPYTFEMPGQNATVAANFKKAEVALEEITLDKTTATVLVGKTVPLTATKVPEDTTDETAITWTSDTPAVATVSASGVVTGVAAGTATITAACGDIKATCTVTVTAEVKPCTAIALDKTTADVKKGETVTLKATTTPADTTDEITWESSAPAVATVKDGVVTGVARGTATITVKCGEFTATCKVSVTEDKTVTAPVAAGDQKSYDVVSTVDGKEVKTVDTVYAITEADLQCEGYEVTITNNSNGKSITKKITNAYKSVTVKSAEDLGNDTFTGYFLVVRVKNVPKDVTLSYKFSKIS